MTSRMSVDTLFSEQFRPLKLRSRSPRTVDLYLISLRNFRKFLCRTPSLDDLCDLTVNRYLAWFRELPRSPYSVNKEHANITAIWRFACQQGYVQKWPTVQREIEPHREPVAWMEAEMHALFEVAQQQTGHVAGVPAALWWSCLLLVLWDTGERIGAVTAAEWANVDLRGGWIRVPAEHRKGKRSDRLYRLSAETVELLKTLKRHTEEKLFPWSLAPTYLWDKYTELLKQAKLPTDSRSKFHRVRRTVASYFEANGGNATELLGHSTRKVTERYLDRRIVRQTQAADLIFRLNNTGEATGCPTTDTKDSSAQRAKEKPKK